MTPDDFTSGLQARGYGGSVGLRVTNFAGTVLYEWNARQVFPAASTIKVPLLLLALELSQRGELKLKERVTLRGTDRVPGAGVLHELQPGLNLSWRDVLTLMIVVSDNTATNLLIERLGTERVNDWLAARGLNDTRLVGQLQLPPARQNEAQRRGERNRTSAHDQTTLLLGLVTGLDKGRRLDPHHTALALDILGRQQLRDLIGRGIPAAADGTPLYRVASKSGELPGIHHDVGLLYTPRPLVVALLSQGGSDLREHPDNRDVQHLSAALWPLLAALGQAEAGAGKAHGGGDI